MMIFRNFIASKSPLLLAVFFLGLSGRAGVVFGQTTPPGTYQPVMEGSNSVPITILTVGGITYARYTLTLGGCLLVAGAGPVTRAGSAFSFDIDVEMQLGVACPDDVFQQTSVVALGVLPPGAYTFTATSWGAPFATYSFTVGANPEPTLVPLSFTAGGVFQIQLNGVAGVSYILQSSTNLTSWTSLSTNLFGSPLEDPAAAGAGQRFYRVLVGP